MILELLGVSEFLNKINLGETLLMSIASNMCNFKMGKKWVTMHVWTKA
jgi:hypothetical protein